MPPSAGKELTDLKAFGRFLRWGSRTPAALFAWRPVLSAHAATLLVAVYFTLFANLTFWTSLVSIANEDAAGGGLFAVVLVALLVANWTLATLVNIRGVFKPVVAALLCASVMVDHFMRSFGVMIDATMIRNAVETERGEALELITPRLVLHMLVYGALPLACLLRAKIRYRKPLAELGSRLAFLFVGLAFCGGIGACFYKDIAAFMRNHRELRHLITPFNYLEGIRRYANQQRIGTTGIAPIGIDARRKESPQSERARLVVLVVGETARAANFSLNGYQRETNPELDAEGAVSFASVHSCATDTSTSLRCMFSGLGQTEYNDDVGKYRENLLDVLQHAGINVLWRENNTGCKNVCDRVPTEVLSGETIPEFCSTGECFDGVLLAGLDDLLSKVSTDAVIVLHQHGSHGPAYYKRYPDAFRRFVPTCDTQDLSQCTREAIVNTYDNTILYTDHVLAEVIRLLRHHADRLDIGLIYVSDHGESLGENNVYLHSLPYWIAPEVQTHIPMVLWLGDGMGLEQSCISGRRDTELSHDHLFHTILGLMDVETQLYDPTLDLLAPCRTQGR